MPGCANLRLSGLRHGPARGLRAVDRVPKARILRAVSDPGPYLGENCATPYPKGMVLRRWLWLFVQSTVFRWSPRPLHGFRASLLKLFGADITGPVVIFPTARVVFPWQLSLAPRSM